jgi:hypothetical protein
MVTASGADSFSDIGDLTRQERHGNDHLGLGQLEFGRDLSTFISVKGVLEFSAIPQSGFRVRKSSSSP